MWSTIYFYSMSSVTEKEHGNQTNNSGDNNLGHFFKATDFDEIAMKVKIMKIISNISPYFVLAFFYVRSS